MQVSTRTDLVPAPLPGRPLTVTIDGWTTFISVKDAAYLKEKKEWKRKLSAAHPDRTGKQSTKEFRLLRNKYISFLLRQQIAYWQLGLMPPDWKGAPKAPFNRKVTMRKARLNA